MYHNNRCTGTFWPLLKELKSLVVWPQGSFSGMSWSVCVVSQALHWRAQETWNLWGQREMLRIFNAANLDENMHWESLTASQTLCGSDDLCVCVSECVHVFVCLCICRKVHLHTDARKENLPSVQNTQSFFFIFSVWLRWIWLTFIMKWNSNYTV